jgi:NhaP-type Na+/H+ or K+/H+ antiporter
MASTIFIIGIIFFLAHLFVALFERTKIPDVLLLILLGVLWGPVLGMVSPDDFGKAGAVMSTLALIVILFDSGMTLNLRILLPTMAPTLVLSLVTFAATVAVAATIGFYIMGLPLIPSLILGGTIGGTSSAVVIPMVQGLKMSEKTGTILVMESALTDVLCIVLVFGMVDAALLGTISAEKMTQVIFKAIFFAALIGFAGSVIWLLVLHMIRSYPNTLLSTFAFAFVLYGIAEMLGYSGAITSLTFGIGLTHHRELNLHRYTLLKHRSVESVSDTETKIFREILFILKTFFFIYLGISIQFGKVTIAFFGILMVICIYAARLLITRLTLSRKTSGREAGIVSVMIPKGLAAAVLASIPLQKGIEAGAAIQDITYIVVLFSIVVTSVMVVLIERGILGGLYGTIFRSFGTVADIPAAAGNGKGGAGTDGESSDPQKP